MTIHNVYPGNDAGMLGIGGPAKPAPAPEAVLAFTKHADQVMQIVRMKDAAYGGAWRRQGYMGNLARLMSKMARIENMLWKDDESNGIGASVGGESVADTLHDMMALAAFMLANFEYGNRWGGEVPVKAAEPERRTIECGIPHAHERHLLCGHSAAVLGEPICVTCGTSAARALFCSGTFS